MKTWKADSGIRPCRACALLLVLAVVGVCSAPLIAGTIDVRIYGVLSNDHAGPDFNVLVLQPNNPPGAEGDYSAEAIIDHPPLAGAFSVDFTWIGAGSPLDPGVAPAQAFQIKTYDNNPGDASYGDLISSTIGSTSPPMASAVPEPSTGFSP